MLSFDLRGKDSKRIIASVITTHLQHSEVPEHPTEKEVSSRFKQMEKIAFKIQEKIIKQHPVIFTGDLNQEEKELAAFFAKQPIASFKRDESVRSQITWGGDKWCADLMHKKASKPLVLDYTLAFGKIETIRTQIFDSGYQGEAFLLDALSDHHLLFSEITLS